MHLAAIALAILTGGSTTTENPSFLVFTKTAAFRHDSILAGKKALQKLSLERGWSVTFTEDSTWFTPVRLNGFDAIVFLLTTGDVLIDEQQAAMESFVKAGGGYVGVHAAADTEYDWPWYGKLVGAYFKTHPAIQEAAIRIEDSKHPTMKGLPNPWIRADEWYVYRENPRGKVRVLATVDESTYQNGGMGADHPIIWCHESLGGRAWYTGLGHTDESYSDPMFLRHLEQGMRWVAQTK